MDITNPKTLKLKGILFLFLVILSGGLLIAIAADWRVALLLGISIWASARFYYFAFYVLEHYADPQFRYSGLWDLIKYLITNRSQ